MVSAIAFPSPVMRIDRATNEVVVERRDPDTGEVASQSPTDGALRRERAALAQAASRGVSVPPVAAAPAPAAAFRMPSIAAPTPASAPVAAPAAAAVAAGRVSIFV
jgi:hypothetical protein